MLGYEILHDWQTQGTADGKDSPPSFLCLELWIMVERI
jgi:hypothetical protein